MADSSNQGTGLKSTGIVLVLAALYFIVNGITLKEGAGILGQSVLNQVFQNINVNDQMGNIGTGIASLLAGGGMIRAGFNKGKSEK
jgi:hypothetical protein